MEIDYNPRAKECIERAKKICQELEGTSVHPMDVFMATLLARHESIQMFLSYCTSNPIVIIQESASYCQNIKRIKKKNISWKREASKIINKAKEEAINADCSFVGVEHLFLSALKHSEEIKNFLAGLAVDNENFYESFQSFNENLNKEEEPVPHGMHAKARNENSYIDKYCDHINSRVLDKKFQFFGRDDEIKDMMTALCRKQKSNVVLVGEAGVGKTALVEGLALAMESPPKDSDIAFVKMDLLELKLSDMLAGAIYRGEFEKRLNETVKEIQARPAKTVVFIDEFHMIVGAGDKEGSMDAANILKPALANGELSCIGATTWAEYKKYIEKDSALSRRFEVIVVNEPSVEETTDILLNCKGSYEDFHDVQFSEHAISRLVKAADTYIPYRRFPDKAFDLLDEAGTFFKLRQCKRPQYLIDLENELREFIATEGKDKSKVGAYDKKAEEFRDGMEKWTEEISKMPPVGVADIDSFITKKFKLGSERTSLEETLKQKIVGQSEVIEEFVTLQRAMALQRRKNRPRMSVLLAGPQGVGKTLLPSLYAEFLPSGLEGLEVFDMSQYRDEMSVNKLIGSSAGYVGYDKGGVLTEKLKKNPKSVLLFENIDRAHPAVIDILAQIINSGLLHDNIGQKINCSQATVFFTTTQVQKQSAGFGDTGQSVIDKRKLPADILNAVDKLLVFKHLDKESLVEIARRHLEENVLNIQTSTEVLEYVVGLCDSETGARPVISKVEELLVGSAYRKLSPDTENETFFIKKLDKTFEATIINSDE